MGAMMGAHQMVAHQMGFWTRRCGPLGGVCKRLQARTPWDRSNQRFDLACFCNCRTRSLRADYDLTSRHKPPMLLRVKDAGGCSAVPN